MSKKIETQRRQIRNILITGGCGFIGTNLVRYLYGIEEHLSIRIIDNFSVGQPEDLKRVCSFKMHDDARQGLLWNEGITLVRGDITDPELAKNVCLGANAVVHLAANTGVMPSIEDPRMDFHVNLLGTFAYLDACRDQSVSRFVLASSGATLGEQQVPIHEEMVPHPISPYGASKLSGEAYCSAYFRSFDLQSVCLRFGNVYGPYSTNKNSVIARFIKQILSGESLTIYGDGTQTRDFIFIDDLCAAIWKSLTISDVGGQVFQIATHREHTVENVAETLAALASRYLGVTCQVRYEAARKGDVKRNYSDISKAKQLLDWEPGWKFADGMEETFKWFISEAKPEEI